MTNFKLPRALSSLLRATDDRGVASPLGRPATPAALSSEPSAAGDAEAFSFAYEDEPTIPSGMTVAAYQEWSKDGRKPARIHYYTTGEVA